MSVLRRRAISVVRARSTGPSSIGDRISARTTARPSFGSASSRSHASRSRTSARSKNAADADQAVGDAPLLEGGRDLLALVADRAHQHRALARDDAVGDQPLELGGDRLRLRALVLAAPEGDRLEAADGGLLRAARSFFGRRSSLGSTTACAASRIGWLER